MPATTSFLPDLASNHFDLGCERFRGPVAQPLLLFLRPPLFLCALDYKLVNADQHFSKFVFILFISSRKHFAHWHTFSGFTLLSLGFYFISKDLCSYFARLLHQTLMKDGNKDFVVGYCNWGERTNSTSLKEKAGGFLALGWAHGKVLEYVREEVGEGDRCACVC